jgi:hypothetical protein
MQTVWIPAFAGMTHRVVGTAHPTAPPSEGVQRGEALLPGLGVVSPIPFIFPQDWGIKGVDETQPGAYQVVR